MSYTTDHDGKSKTASAVDRRHYPEQNEVNDSGLSDVPTHDEVAGRAFHIWLAKGCPEGSAEQDWRQAELELSAEGRDKPDLIQGRLSSSGSVQP